MEDQKEKQQNALEDHEKQNKFLKKLLMTE